MPSPVRILLADDHESVREGICALLAGSLDVRVIAEANDDTSAIAMARSLAPDVVVMGLSLPANALAAIRLIKREQPGIAIVVWSQHRDAAYARAAFESGAIGYVLKHSPFIELKRAVVAAAGGEQYLDKHLTDEPMSSAIANGSRAHLSQRETEVLRRSAAGFSNKEIGSELKIAVKTVEAHKANAMRKLHLADRASVVRFAVMQGWLQD